MKKMYFSILLVTLIAVNILVSIFIYDSRFISRESEYLFSNYEVLYNYLNSHESIPSGSIEVTAKYRGAHGENYPNYFNFDYSYVPGKVTFTSENGYIEYEYDAYLLSIINILKNLKPADIEKFIEINNNRLIIDKEKLNDLNHQNFKNVEINFNSHGLIRKLDNVEIILDDLKVIIKDKEIEADYHNNSIKITLNSLGYSLDINNTLKMNAFLNKDKNTYSIIIKDKVFHVEYSNKELVIKALSEGSIYNGLDLVVKRKSNVIINNESVLTNDDVPIIRYYTNIDTDFWRGL